MCPGAAPASSPQSPSAGWGHTEWAAKPRDASVQVEPSLYFPSESRHSLKRGRQQGWPCPDCPGKDLLPQGVQRSLPTQLQMLVFKKQPAPAWFLAIFAPKQPPLQWPIQPHPLWLRRSVLHTQSAAGGQSSGAAVAGCSLGIYFYSALHRQ